jgi:pre-mRNA-splicing helicase BRR2
MADKKENNLAQFKYAAMSNLVLQADRRFVTRRGDENTGDPESLAGRISIRDMGSRMAREDAPSQGRKLKAVTGVERGSMKEGQDVLERESKKGKRDGAIVSQQDQSIEGIIYRPRTPATRAVFELIITICARYLSEMPHNVLRSAVDFILEILKDEDKKEHDKKKEVDEALGVEMTSKEYNELVNLSKKLTDYGAQDEDEEMADRSDNDDTALDDRQGVAVLFDEEDDDEDAGPTFEVRDEADTSDEEADPSGLDNAITRPEDEDIMSSGSMDLGENMDVNGRSHSTQKEEAHNSLVPVHDIDTYWLQRQIGLVYDDAHVQQEKTQDALAILSGVSENNEEKQLREIENDLMELFDFEHHNLVAKLVLNRDRIVWVTRWHRASDNEARIAIEREMVAAGQRHILEELRRDSKTEDKLQALPKSLKVDLMDVDIPQGNTDTAMPDSGLAIHKLQPRRLVNLENLVFDQGNHFMSNQNVKLPAGTTKKPGKGWEEIHIPAPKSRKDPNDPTNKPISELDAWVRPAFGNAPSLNRIQTKVYPSMFLGDGNALICSPTGSGKTFVALLAMMRVISQYRNPDTGEIDLDGFKIFYLSPLKALVAEQVGSFSKRFEPYGIRVAELTGDRQLTKQQIAEAQIIVSTPEKLDVISRKATDTSYLNLVRLIVIDECHLLHDERGPVIESIVSRTIRRSELTGQAVRLVALSATLPNYRDVASFLRVDITKDLHYFDSSFRPVPLKQQFIGVTDKKAIKQVKTMKEVCYRKILEHVGQKRQQMLVFCHSRKETAKTAKYVLDRAMEDDTIGQIMRSDAASREILKDEAASIQGADNKNFLNYGLSIHHAGLPRHERTVVEDLFSEHHTSIIFCTATLAWGVNVPAAVCIILGTQVYSPEKGSWVELSPQDVLQMLGRAGRPQFDTQGEGIIITTAGEMQYYLSLLNEQLPIESQFMRKLADNLNAEIVLGTVKDRDEGIDWLGYTYLYVRMMRSPALYRVGAEYEDDLELQQKRCDLIHSAATILERTGLIKYHKQDGKFTSTELGRIASHYYLSHSSMAIYNQHLQPSTTVIELFRIFSLSEEFKYIPVRQDEKLELAKLLGRVPIPVKEGIDEPQAKINVLLQAYISRLKLEGLALMADLVYVTQSAGRIIRAIYEISLKKGWAAVAKAALDLCKMAEKRMWPTMSPLRQFPSCPRDIIQKVERIDVPWKNYFDLNPPQMSELIGLPKSGRIVCDLVKKFPRLSIDAHVQPVTPSLLRVEITVSPDFEWDIDLHGYAEMFWVFVEDCDGDSLLHHQQFLLLKQYAESEENQHLIDFTVPVAEPLPPNYFITIISDRWMQSESKIAVSLQKLQLPSKFPPHTRLLDLQPLPVSALKVDEYQKLYPDVGFFNKIQTQTFTSLYGSTENVLVAASNNAGSDVCAEFALLKHWASNQESRALYIAPFQELVDLKAEYWVQRLSHLAGGKKLVKLTGDLTRDLKLLGEADLVLATPSQWDTISRQWQRRKNVQNVGLFIADYIHMIGGHGGYVYEVVVSRMRAMALQLESSMRVIALSVPLSNARDVGEWIGATKHNIYNFSPQHRAVPIQIQLQSYSIPHFPSLMLAMARPTYQAIVQYASDKPSLVFTPTRKQVRASAQDLLEACMADDDENRFLHASYQDLKPILDRIGEKPLSEALSHGIGYFHEALSAFDKRAVKQLYKMGAIQVVLVSRDSCWEWDLQAHLVIIMGTQFFEGREHRYIHYPISDILQMFGKAGRSGIDKSAYGVLMVSDVKREYYKKFLGEALPIESHLHAYLSDAFVAEISSKVITNTQDALDWSTYTFFYRRLLANPTYYGLSDRTHEALSAFLTQLVDATLKELSDAQIIEVDEDSDDVTPLNPAMIAAYYNITFITMQTFLLSLNAKTRLKGLIEIVTSATEFEDIQIRRHEEHVLKRIYDRVPVKLGEVNYGSPHFKACILLQAYLLRMRLPVDLERDQEMIIKKLLDLLSACTDILSSEGHANALTPMELSQMVVQAMWQRDSPLKQLPYFEDKTVEVANEAGINDVVEFMDAMDPENPHYKQLITALGLSNKQLSAVADFVNNYYPNINLSFEVVDPDDIVANEPVTLQITAERDIDEDEEIKTEVHAPFYPSSKSESWWFVVTDEANKTLLAIKRSAIGRKLNLKLEFIVPSAGRHTLTLNLISDSYVGVDQAPTFEIEAAEGNDDDDEDEDEDEDEE